MAIRPSTISSSQNHVEFPLLRKRAIHVKKKKLEVKWRGKKLSHFTRTCEFNITTYNKGGLQGFLSTAVKTHTNATITTKNIFEYFLKYQRDAAVPVEPRDSVLKPVAKSSFVTLVNLTVQTGSRTICNDDR